MAPALSMSLTLLACARLEPYATCGGWLTVFFDAQGWRLTLLREVWIGLHFKNLQRVAFCVRRQEQEPLIGIQHPECRVLEEMLAEFVGGVVDEDDVLLAALFEVRDCLRRIGPAMGRSNRLGRRELLAAVDGLLHDDFVGDRGLLIRSGRRLQHLIADHS